jgi:TolB protein
MSSVTASAAGLSSSSAITVAQTAESISLTPTLDTLFAIGDTLRVAAVAFDRNGNPLPEAAFRWQSSQSSVAAVAQTGTVTAAANGTATIGASMGPVQASVVVVIDAPETIVFTSSHSGDWQIYSIRSDGTNLRQLTNTPGAKGSVVSPDGSQVAYTLGSAIYLMSTDGSNQRLAFNTGIQALVPTWSPDGQALAAVIQPSGPDARPFTYSIATGALTPLPYGTTMHTLLTWSSEEPIIAAEAAGQAGIVVFGTDRDTSRVLTTMSGANSPRYDPQGERIAFVGPSPGGVTNVHIMRRDGSGLVRIPSTSTEYGPAWSSAGTKIVFVRIRDLWIMNADGSGARQLTSFGTGYVINPSCRN